VARVGRFFPSLLLSLFLPVEKVSIGIFFIFAIADRNQWNCFPLQDWPAFFYSSESIPFTEVILCLPRTENGLLVFFSFG
jgi:hypothetical protein